MAITSALHHAALSRRCVDALFIITFKCRVIRLQHHLLGTIVQAAHAFQTATSITVNLDLALGNWTLGRLSGTFTPCAERVSLEGVVGGALQRATICYCYAAGVYVNRCATRL
jgi:hypothetical protein